MKCPLQGSSGHRPHRCLLSPKAAVRASGRPPDTALTELRRALRQIKQIALYNRLEETILSRQQSCRSQSSPLERLRSAQLDSLKRVLKGDGNPQQTLSPSRSTGALFLSACKIKAGGQEGRLDSFPVPARRKGLLGWVHSVYGRPRVGLSPLPLCPPAPALWQQQGPAGPAGRGWALPRLLQQSWLSF